jgi:O-antigen ligase
MQPGDTRISATLRDAGPVLCRGELQLAPLLGQVCVISLVCGSLLLPAIVLREDLPYFKAEVAALPIVLAIYGWLVLSGIARGFRLNGMFLIGSLFSVSVTLSIWYGSTILGETVILRDFYELPKLWLPIVFFTLCYEARLSEVAIRRLWDFLGLTIVPICLYAWAQWENLPFSRWLNEYYKAGEYTEGALLYARRVYSTMGNPNNFAELLTWLISAFLLAALLFPANRTRNILAAIACLASMTMTGSRYGLLNTSLALFLVFAMNYASRGRRLSQLFLPLALVPLLAGVFLAVSSSNQGTLERFQTLDNPIQTDSYRERVDLLWRDAYREFVQSPVLGHGPAKNIFSGIVTDSEYLDVLKEFGVAGSLTYLAYFLFPLSLIWKGMRAGQRAGAQLEERLPGNFLVMRLSFIMIVTALLMNVGMSTFRNFLLQGFLWMWMGLGVRAAETIREASRPRLSYSSPSGSLNAFAAHRAIARAVR